MVTSLADARVALITNSVAMGGVEEHVRQIAAGLRERRAAVLAVVPEDGAVDELAVAARRAGAAVVRLTLASQKHRLGSLRRFFRLVRLLRAWRPDVCHVHLIGFTGGRWIIVAARLAGVPRLLCTVHIAPAEPQPTRVRLERSLLGRLVDRYVAVSRASRDHLIANLGLPPAKVEAVPNGVQLERFAAADESDRCRVRRAFGVEPAAPVVGVVARLSEQKGLTHLIAATPAILREHPDTQIVVVGEGPLRAALEQQARSIGVADHVRLVGYRTDVAACLRAMDVFVLPSLYEGLPLSVLEAMGAGLPVVATRVDGTPEAVGDGDTAVLVPPADPAALAAAVNSVLGDPDRAAAMAAAGRARAALFSTSTLLDRLAPLYLGRPVPG